MYKIIGITILIFGLSSIFATFGDLSPFWFNNREQKIETLWRQDLELLFRTKTLPKQLSDISEIKITPLSEDAKNLIQKIKHPFVTKKEGNFILEVTVDYWEEMNEKGILLQYNLVDKKNGNTIWELGRTLLVN